MHLSPFVKNLLIRALATAVIFGGPTLVAAWSTGSYGDKPLFLSAGAFILGGLGSAAITWASTVLGSGDKYSGSFTQ